MHANMWRLVGILIALGSAQFSRGHEHYNMSEASTTSHHNLTATMHERSREDGSNLTNAFYNRTSNETAFQLILKANYEIGE